MNTSMQRGDAFASNVPRFFLYTALQGFAFGLITALWLIYLLQRRGLTLTQATIVDVAFWIASTVGELPTGIVADRYGRKISLVAGAALMSVSILAWAYAPTIPLIMLAYVGLAIGTTFLTGAQDAFFYETLERSGRAGEYTRLVGRVGATMLGATALGSIASGLFATIDLIMPFLVAGLCLLAMLGVVLTFKEPQSKEGSAGQARQSYTQVLRHSIALMRARPTLRYPMIYLTLVPLAAVLMETFFLQPQAVSLGVPIAGVGAVVMAVQIVDMAGSTWSDAIKARFGAGRAIYAAPVLIVSSLVLLALLQILPALLFIAIIGFVTAVLRPLLLNSIQNEVPDDVRATVLSMQSLMFTFLLTISEPALGFVADRSGLPTAYLGLAGSLGILVPLLLLKSRRYFPAHSGEKEPTANKIEANA
jgi:MFS family permease